MSVSEAVLLRLKIQPMFLQILLIEIYSHTVHWTVCSQNHAEWINAKMCRLLMIDALQISVTLIPNATDNDVMIECAVKVHN